MKKVEISGVVFNTVVGNAATPLTKDFEGVLSIVQSKSGFVLLKTATLFKRVGNKIPNFTLSNNCSVNNIGLANNGVDFFIDVLKKLGSIQKPIIASVATFELSETLSIVEKYQTSGLVDLIEINISCPNIESKSVLGYNLLGLERFLTGYFNANQVIPVGLKLPPYLDKNLLQSVCKLINKFPIAFVSSINTLGLAKVYENDFKDSLADNDGFGGLGGSCVKPIGLGNVSILRSNLDKKIKIFGVGGVSSSQDVLEYLHAGADLVQIGTYAWINGAQVFNIIVDELNSLD